MKPLSLKISLSAALFAAFAASPASADEVAFAYSRSDLASSGAISALYERLKDKAESACDVRGYSGLFRMRYRQSCSDALVSEFVAGIDNQLLTAIHEERRLERFAANG